MKSITLNRRSAPPLYALVDDDIYTKINGFNWYAHITGYSIYSSGDPDSRKQVLMHRYIMELELGRPLERSEEIDHIDRNGLNNQRSNLRICTSSQNRFNTVMHADNIIGYKGINYDKRQNDYIARICVNYKVITSHKTVDNPKDAAIEYDLLAIKFAGKFARLNFEDNREAYIKQIANGWEPTPAREQYSSYKYVSYNKAPKHSKNPWSAACYEGSKRISIGYYPEEELAATDADIFMLNRYGNGAELNFPERVAEYTKMRQEGYKVGTKRSKSSQYTGVNFQKNKKNKPWRSYIEKDGKRKYLGNFATEIEAYDARQAWIKYHK